MFNNEKGATLLELVVVIGITAIVVGALVFATIASLRNAQFSKNQAQATKLAQEGVERIRGSRDQNSQFAGLSGVSSWNGGVLGSGSIWDYQVYNNCGSGAAGTACYFKFSSAGSLNLTYIGGSTVFPTSAAEQIPPGAPLFHRAVVLNDDSGSYNRQKTVTVIVEWKDFSGSHQSRLTTILRKI